MLRLFRCLKGLGLKCPHCGIGPLTRNFLGSVEKCHDCGYTFLGQTGDFWGGVVLTYVFAGGAGITVAALLINYEIKMSTMAVTFVAAGIVVAASFLAFPFFKGQSHVTEIYGY